MIRPRVFVLDVQLRASCNELFWILAQKALIKLRCSFSLSINGTRAINKWT